jgi:hypothetical protein
LIWATTPEEPTARAVSGCKGADIGSGGLLGGAHRLDPDGLGEISADAEADVADLANDVGVAADELDLLIFAEAHFAEAMGDFRRGGQLFDANRHTSLDLIQRAGIRVLALAGGGAVVVRL